MRMISGVSTALLLMVFSGIVSAEEVHLFDFNKKSSSIREMYKRSRDLPRVDRELYVLLNSEVSFYPDEIIKLSYNKWFITGCCKNGRFIG